jgi:hypothetical protein
MIIQLTNSDDIRPLKFINTNHIATLTNQYEWNDEGTKKWCVGGSIRFSDGSAMQVHPSQLEHIEHYLRLQYLKDSAEVCGKLGIEEEG